MPSIENKVLTATDNQVMKVTAPGSTGLNVGDIILGVGTDAVRTQAQFYERVWSRRHAGDDVPLKVLQGVDVKDISVRSIDRVEYFRPRSTI